MDLLSRRLYPLPDEALLYLERRPGVSRIADAGTALIFGLAIVEKLVSKEKSDKIRDAMLITTP